MRRDLGAMSQAEHDILVVGGGVVGCGIARDAALRGMDVALVEQNDFGWGTTARSTRMAHGGLRYLEQYDFGMVREGLRERERLLRLAPHLVRPLEFLTPIYDGDPHGPLTVRLGMFLYDALSRSRLVPRHRMLSPREVLKLEPGLARKGLRGGATYYDGQINMPERLCIDCLLDATQHGAQVANRAHVLRLTQAADGRVTGAVVRDLLNGASYEVRARVTINATGPWADALIGIVKPGAARRLRTTKGIHLVVPRFSSRAVVMLAKRDDRLFFAVPWLGVSLVGTTDTDYANDPGEAIADEEDVRYLVDETSRVFPGADLRAIHYTVAGVRPLVLPRGRLSPSRTSRRHQVVDHAREGLPGLISVLGGKITTYRAVAEDAVDVATRWLGVNAPCVTAEAPLGGGVIADVDALVDEAARNAGSSCGLTREQAANLVSTYGLRYAAVASLAAKHAELRLPVIADGPEVLAQVRYAVAEEMALSVSDVMLRRMGMGLRPGNGLAAARRVAEVMADVLGWDEARVTAEVERYQADLYLMRGGLAGQVGSTAGPA